MYDFLNFDDFFNIGLEVSDFDSDFDFDFIVGDNVIFRNIKVFGSFDFDFIIENIFSQSVLELDMILNKFDFFNVLCIEDKFVGKFIKGGNFSLEDIFGSNCIFFEKVVRGDECCNRNIVVID